MFTILKSLGLFLVFEVFLFRGTLQLSSTPDRRNLGFVYKGGNADAPVQLEAFVDLTCPDCRRTWPVLREIADFYGPEKMRLTVYLFPLADHKNARIAASSAFLVQEVKPSRLFDWLTIVFNKLDSYSHDAINIIAAHGKDIGVDEVVLKEVTKRRYSAKTDSSFKYGEKRGVYATPFFFMNGRFLKADAPFWPAKKWKRVIKSVLKKM